MNQSEERSNLHIQITGQSKRSAQGIIYAAEKEYQLLAEGMLTKNSIPKRLFTKKSSTPILVYISLH